MGLELLESQYPVGLKIKPIVLTSDDCAIMLGQTIKDGKIAEPGTPVYVHKGESVAIIPIQTMRESIVLGRLVGRAGTGETALERVPALAESFQELCKLLSDRVVAWTWTGNDGAALPCPYKAPGVIEALANEEVMWLIGALQGETGAQRKNGSTPSAGGSTTGAG